MQPAIIRLPLVLIGAIAIFARPALARIGETEQQIEARYGKLVNASLKGMQGMEILIYQSAGMKIGVTFIDGKSAAEFYSKDDNSDLSREEIDVILEANAGGKKWEKAAPALMDAWILDGGQRTAHHVARSLIVQTAAFTKKAAEENAKQAKEKLKGF